MPDRQLSADYPTDLPSWRALKAHFKDAKRLDMREMFAEDPNRFSRFTIKSGDLLLDYSKNRMNDETRRLLIALAREAGVEEATDAMFAGENINVTEKRPALHVALRAEVSDAVATCVPEVKEVWETLERMDPFVSAVQNGRVRGATGQPLTHIVNVGIGGSDLGPVMASRALRQYWAPGMQFHSVSNVDGTQLADLMQVLDPARTLLVICSKTFTTQETMSNANAARHWIIDTLGEDALHSHFAAASTNHEAMDAFGINPEYRFGFWDWVGGRYSIWSAVGLSLALVIGMENFRALLAGGRQMDRHFLEAEGADNMPLMLALISIWYNNFFGAESQAILPYDNRLDRFPAYLQQLQMESSGKSVRQDGEPVTVDTGMIIWGEPGSNAQHSFCQLLHQGRRFVPVDFILPVEQPGVEREQQDLAIFNCLAQGEVLMEGNTTADSFRVHEGNRPSNVLLMNALTPASLGQLIALYEHKVFVENTIWGTNAFDQFGVELGKRVALELEKSKPDADSVGSAPSSTSGLLQSIRDRQIP